ncbi:MAG TPA: winged helix-turn-helix domain-containing protein [Streptosporangiaceae bacterium]|nr:winged helix-turn-helix domain-containing protein [Streptosporangiaceae bacterium]
MHPEPHLQAVHRALADPLRIRLFELLVLRPQSAKELAVRVGLPPDRLYHHLAQLEEGKLIEIAEYRPLAGGKVERVYAPTAAEPLVDDASPADVARLLGAALETTRADINAATLAKQAGEERLISLSRTGVRLNAPHLADLRAAIEDLLLRAREHPDEDGVWTTVLWTAVDREDRRGGSAGAAPAGDIGTVTTASRAVGKAL